MGSRKKMISVEQSNLDVSNYSSSVLYVRFELQQKVVKISGPQFFTQVRVTIDLIGHGFH